MLSGLELIEERPGTGPAAESGDVVVYNLRIYLNRGEELLINEAQVGQGLTEGSAEFIDGRPLLMRRLRLGKREAIAGVEKALIGMRAGGYRRLRVSPHLAYGVNGIAGLIPANAVLTVELWLRNVSRSASSP